MSAAKELVLLGVIITVLAMGIIGGVSHLAAKHLKCDAVQLDKPAVEVGRSIPLKQ